MSDKLSSPQTPAWSEWGNTDYVMTTAGKKPARVFRGDTGQWRLTRVGKKWFARDGQPRTEYVLQLPATFRGRTSQPVW